MEKNLSFDKLKLQFVDVLNNYQDHTKVDFKSKYTNLDIGNLLIDYDFSNFLKKQNEILDNTIKCKDTLNNIKLGDLNMNKQDDVDVVKNTINISNYDLIKVKNDLQYITNYINNLNKKLKIKENNIEKFTGVEHFNISDIIQPLNDFGNTIKQPFVDIEAKLDYFFKNFVQSMKDVIDKIGGIANSVGDVLKKVFNDIFGTLKDIFEFIWQFLQGIGNFIKMLPTYINNGIDFVKTTYNNYIDLMTNTRLHWFGIIITIIVIYIVIMIYSKFTFGIVATPMMISLGPAIVATFYLLLFDVSMLIYMENMYKFVIIHMYSNPLSCVILGTSNQKFVSSGDFNDFLGWVPGNLITCSICFLVVTMIIKTLFFTVPTYLISNYIF